ATRVFLKHILKASCDVAREEMVREREREGEDTAGGDTGEEEEDGKKKRKKLLVPLHVWKAAVRDPERFDILTGRFLAGGGEGGKEKEKEKEKG
ncbi:hypothetical protein HDV00_000909, partial [Rhizophlyctis rosea]